MTPGVFAGWANIVRPGIERLMKPRSFIALLNPLEAFFSLWRCRGLVKQFARQEFLSKYRGSMLGVFWSLILPLLMLAVYTFVFSTVFQNRWATTGAEAPAFSLILFAGLIPFGLFSECITGAPRLILSQPNLVKKVVFPLEVLPVSRALACAVQLLLNSVVLICGVVLFYHVQLTVLALPLVLLPLLLLSIGLMFFIAALGVFVQDVGQIVGVLVSLLIFLTPVFYPSSALPPRVQPFLKLNPLALAVEGFRDLSVLGVWPSMTSMALLWGYGLVAFIFGYAVFVRSKHAFADVV